MSGLTYRELAVVIACIIIDRVAIIAIFTFIDVAITTRSLLDLQKKRKR